MARSPLEMMIDKACGFDRAAFERFRRALVQLECPACHSKKAVAKDKTDAPNASRVVYPCPDCLGSDVRHEVLYYDKLGRQIDGDGNVITKPGQG